MTRSDPAVLGVGDKKGKVTTQKVMRNTVTRPGGTVKELQDILSSATSMHHHVFLCCTLCLLPSNVMGSDCDRKDEENSLIHFHNICLCHHEN